MKPNNRILLVEDHTIVRHGIIRLLKEIVNGTITVEEASNGQEALEKVEHNVFDLVLLDISLPGRNGLEVLKQLHQLRPKLPVIILSMHPETQYAVRALRAGAAGYLTKGSASDELQCAISKVLSGGRYVSPSQAELLAEAVSAGQTCDENLHTTLSDREFQLAGMMTVGMTMTEIANELSLSIKTVSTYRTRILSKLRLKTNAEIINYFITHQLTV